MPQPTKSSKKSKHQTCKTNQVRRRATSPKSSGTENPPIHQFVDQNLEKWSLLRNDSAWLSYDCDHRSINSWCFLIVLDFFHRSPWALALAWRVLALIKSSEGFSAPASKRPGHEPRCAGLSAGLPRIHSIPIFGTQMGSNFVTGIKLRLNVFIICCLRWSFPVCWCPGKVENLVVSGEPV